ncbi:hypothetical protein OG948_57225 (plasmid) [Embleya sp. NBC_00888]|uniref:hypothetical protein n=1 Tax=Embleya sp. NBC_00888 TaxID=2975960 RepID=UPI002F916398|nr:hypothetical protein OG948_02240 [Embleya sp. NBC_00888]WSY47757.1 hypothetical protein OG948_57225 [Embleya sp. NBC_00888]
MSDATDTHVRARRKDANHPEDGARERLLWMDVAVWRRARARAADDALGLTPVLEALLDAYADGRVTVTPPAGRSLGPTRDGTARTGCRTGPLSHHVWSRADHRRAAAGMKSMPVLCELLLGGYVDGHLTTTLTATGHVPRTHREDDAA